MGVLNVLTLTAELALLLWYALAPAANGRADLLQQDLRAALHPRQSLAALAGLALPRLALFVYTRRASKQAPATRAFVFAVFLAQATLAALSCLQPLVYWQDARSFRHLRGLRWADAYVATLAALSLLSAVLHLGYILQLNRGRGRLADASLMRDVLGADALAASAFYPHPQQDDVKLALWRTKWAQLVKQFKKKQTDPTFEAVVRLYAHRDGAVERLASAYDRNPEGFDFYLPQLCAFLLYGAFVQSPQLCAILLEKCSLSHVFAHKMLWYLQSYCVASPALSSAASSTRVKMLIEEVADRGVAPARAVEFPPADADPDDPDHDRELDDSQPLRSRSQRNSGRSATERHPLLPYAPHEREDDHYFTFQDLESGVGRADPFERESTFLTALANLSSNLRSVAYTERNNMLRLWLNDIQTQYMPSNSLYLPVGDPYHRLKRIHVSESFTFSTRERVPYLLCAEVVSYPSPLELKKARRKRGSMFKARRFTLSLWDSSSDLLKAAGDASERPVPAPLVSPEAAKLGFWSEHKPSPRKRSFSQHITSAIPQPGELFNGLIDTLVQKMPGGNSKTSQSGANSAGNSNSDTRGTAYEALLSNHAHYDNLDEEKDLGSPSHISSTFKSQTERSYTQTDASKHGLSIDTANLSSSSSAAGYGRRVAPGPATPSGSGVAQYELESPKSDTVLSPQSLGSPMSPRPLTRFDSTDQFLLTLSERERKFVEEDENANSATGLAPLSATRRGSGDEPLVIFTERWADKERRIQATSEFGALPGWRLLPVIVKSNDDLRQEQLAAQLIKQFAKVFEEGKLPVFLRPYDVIAISPTAGLVEAIADTISIDSLKRNDRAFTTLLDFFVRHFGDPSTSEFRKARSNFFRSLCVRAFLVARKYRHRFILLVEMMLNGNEHLPCFGGDPKATVERLAARFQPELDINSCEDFVHSLIDASLDNWRTKWYDKYQRWRRRHLAASMIQKCFRSYLLRKAFRTSRVSVAESFQTLRAFRHARDRKYWRTVDLRKLKREELRLVALSLNLPSTGKKVLLLGRIQRWMDQHVRMNDLAGEAAAKALESHVKAQGTVYFCEAYPGAEPIDIRPLRGKGITSVAAAAAAGIGFGCRSGVFEDPIESRWLVNPVFMHTLRTEHIVDVNVGRSHAVALAKAGELFSWGENPNGELGFAVESADAVARNRATVVAAIATYQSVAVAVGRHHTIAVCDEVAGHDGVAFCWGSNSFGQLGTATLQSCDSDSSCKDAPARSSACSGTINGSSVSFPKPFVMHQVELLRKINIRQVACGALHSMALSSHGRVYSWGCNDGGRLGHGILKAKEQIVKPAMVGGALEKLIVVAIACSTWHSACIAAEDSAATVGRVFTWGTGIYGQSVVVNEELAARIACGMHHTAVLTVENRVFMWGSVQQFSPHPQKLQLADGAAFGKIASLSCGRTFVIFNTLSRNSESYEKREAHRLWRAQPTVIPTLNLSKIPPLPLSSSCFSARKSESNHPPPPPRLEPQADRKHREREEQREAERVDAINIEAIVHPLCRVCWRCNGFQPSPLKLWVCRNCYHEKLLHGLRPKGAPLGEYEAVRKLQCLHRARKARRLMQRAREKHYQRVFSIKHNDFFYYNLWRSIVSWEQPPEIGVDVDIPIRDPDVLPIIKAPLTRYEAAVVIQSHRRAVVKNTMLWIPPALLKRLYDLGDPIEIQRLKRFTNMTVDDAARVLQGAFRAHKEKQRARRTIRSRFKRIFDDTSEQYFYYNTVTKESTWEKPKLLRDNEDIDRAVADPDAAARTIQALFRRFVCRKLFFELLSRRYRKLIDPSSGMPYYYDSVLNCASWLKPSVLGEFDLEILEDEVTTERDGAAADGWSPLKSPAARKSTVVPGGVRRATGSPTKLGATLAAIPRISERARVKRHKRRLQKLRQMSRDEAAGGLQRTWRAHKARAQLRQLLFEAYEKVYDPVMQHYYYYNTKTGAVKWTKPWMLEDRDLRVVRHIKRRRLEAVVDPQEAARVLQGFLRYCVARNELHRLLRARIDKVWDPHARQYYYFDKRTGQSSWAKPVLLRHDDLPST
ncbi:hypothetical protein PybrP1_002507 [[Pythium] brassicae (nom. inval.)]|nr:hypothetical protein PybrP1_002507 [[Pythium] brassicae (nom. inval.)]